MSEATPLEAVINQPVRTEREPVPSPIENVINPPKELPLYPLTAAETVVQLYIKRGDKTETIQHKLRRPTFAELLEREQQSVAEVEEVAPNEDAWHEDSQAANAKLWDKVCLGVTGYRIGGQLATEFVAVSPELAAKIPLAHKHAAISGLYLAKCTLEAGEEEGFSLDGDSYVIRQTLGDENAPSFVLLHTLRQPTEAELREYNKRASTATSVSGARKRKIRIRTNLKADVELYDKLATALSGATPPDPRGVDPILKRQVVQTLIAGLNASLLD